MDTTSIQVDILNPKAGKLLKDLAELNLISIREIKEDDSFLKVVKKLRSKSKDKRLSFDEITREVETVRAKRYAKAKR